MGVREGGVQPNQVHWKSVKRGFEFTLMVVGESGLGKSTLINSLFLTDLYSKDCPGPSCRIKMSYLSSQRLTHSPQKSAIFKKKKKKQIMKKIQEHKIKIYEFPDVDEDDDNKLVRKIKEKMPLAVVGSNVVIEVNSKKVRGCQYPWGVAEVENVEQFDFTVLRNMLIRTHMQDLKDVTNNINYKNYRSKKIASR
ncbi:septin-7-like [Neolamprologus brichardi]|uniref:septin-7-like n=1 Tax=Neolamprologus brichardi TaxID=32507 RepID=UPI0003EC2B83|nr:septin-7-like [Neolamprologus brichardi]